MVSLGSATGTNIESGCKHILTCRLDTEKMRVLSEDSRDLGKNPKYNMNQGDMVLVSGPTWGKGSVLRREDAYPLVITNLGDLKREGQNLIKFLYHNVSSVYERKQIIDAFNGETKSSFRLRTVEGVEDFIPHKDGMPTINERLMNQLCDCTSFGVALTVAYATGTKGDTAGSVMIGGMVTVTNGDFHVKTGDIIQFYWDFERDCFDKYGYRKAMNNAVPVPDPAGRGQGTFAFDNQDPSLNPDADGPPLGPMESWDISDGDKAKKVFNTRGNDIRYRGSAPRITAFVKPYKEDEKCERLYDKIRIIGRANNDCTPGHKVDIILGRQSM